MKRTKNLIEIFLSVLVTIAIGYAVYLFVVAAPVDTNNLIDKSRIDQYQKIMAVYRQRWPDYRGSCIELQAPSTVNCVDGVSGYRISTPLGIGLYCVDASGFRGTVPSLPANALTCN